MKRIVSLGLSLALSACAARGPGGTRTTTPPVASTPATPLEAACVQAPELRPGETVRGTTTGRADLFHAQCAYGAASSDAVYRFRVLQPSHVVLRMSGSYDTVVHLRSACGDPDTELACNDDAGDERHSVIEADVPAGEYFAVVDGYASEGGGFYALELRVQPTRVPTTAARIARSQPGEGATITPGTGSGPVQGTVTFQKRSFTPHGLTQATEDRPAPRFVVEAVGEDGAVVAEGDTDEAGAFSLALPTGRSVRVRAVTRTRHEGHDLRVVSDPGTERLYEVSTAFFMPRGGEQIALHATVGGVESAGAFNILSQFVKYTSYTQRAFGRALPPLYAFWRRGNNASLPQGNITAFLRDYHRHRGAFALQIQGGAPGREDASDSDQFDDPVVLHEFTHFVVHTMSGNYSMGGRHGDNELHFPGLALDEGAADAIATAVSGDGRYWDTAGLEPNGSIIVQSDSEAPALRVRGIGAQNVGQGLLWDLADGAENLPDRDNDGIAIGLTGVLRIYASFRDEPGALVGVHTILERAVRLGLVTTAQAERIVHTPAELGFGYPVPAQQQWPQDLTLPAEATGRIDGRSQPAPSGGVNVPMNGFDAIRTYRVRLERRALLTLELNIRGVGTQRSFTDLDLAVYGRDLELVVSSVSETPRERIHRWFDAGTYFVMVRDAGRGNAADYTLSVRASDQFH